MHGTPIDLEVASLIQDGLNDFRVQDFCEVFLDEGKLFRYLQGRHGEKETKTGV